MIIHLMSKLYNHFLLLLFLSSKIAITTTKSNNVLLVVNFDINIDISMNACEFAEYKLVYLRWWQDVDELFMEDWMTSLSYIWKLNKWPDV